MISWQLLVQINAARPDAALGSRQLLGHETKTVKQLIDSCRFALEFLYIENVVSLAYKEKFTEYSNELARILKLKDNAIYFTRYLTTVELNALINLIMLYEELISIGYKNAKFISGLEYVMKFYDGVDVLTRHYNRWFVRK